ncbi:MAG: anti-sigma F factor antagonist [Treponema sp. CETP13]|nr:MAG: anti-sigma F factor antagonist [Treponema sp. CETP13]
MEQLGIQEKEGSNYILLNLSGTINSYTFSEFQKKAYEYIKKANLVLDMGNVLDIDSSGLGVILGVFNESEETGNKLYIMHPSLAVAEALESTGFLESFNRIYSVTEVD